MGRTIIKVVGTIVSALATIFFNIQQAVSLLGYNVDWKWLTLGSFILFVGFVSWWISGLEADKRQRENSKPNLVFKKAQDWQFYKERQAIYHALQVWFVNNPQVASDNSVARDVTVVVTFYDRNIKNKLEIHGCFTEAEVPDYATIAPIKDLKDRIDVWPPNDIPQKLLIALKYPGDESAYGFAKSNFVPTQDGRELGKEIKKGEHYVKVTLRGTRVDQPPSWFILTNPGREGNLSLSNQIKKPDLCKEGFQSE